MQAEIQKETDNGFDVFVTDNNGIGHKIGVCYDGEIDSYLQQGYPEDPTKRSMIDEVEPINQAKRYAKHHIKSERGYETVDWRQDPDRIAAVALMIAGVDNETISQWFDELFAQVRSHFSDVDRPVSLPDEIRPGHLNYQQDIYLERDHQGLTPFDGLAAALNPSIFTANTTVSPQDVTTVIREAVLAEQSNPDLPTLKIDAVSGVYLRWDDSSGTYHHNRHRKPTIDRKPDVRLDILPFDPNSIVMFQSQLVDNLVCQVRDCYIEMGVCPPEPYRVQGVGKHKTSTWYEHYDFYQRYHDPAADIDWEAVESPTHRQLLA